jgi:hypothetical protein
LRFWGCSSGPRAPRPPSASRAGEKQPDGDVALESGNPGSAPG